MVVLTLKIGPFLIAMYKWYYSCIKITFLIPYDLCISKSVIKRAPAMPRPCLPGLQLRLIKSHFPLSARFHQLMFLQRLHWYPVNEQ